MHDTAQLEHRAESARIHVSHGLTEGSLFFQVAGWNPAFENHLRRCRHFQVDGLALYQLDGLAHKATRQCELVGVLWHLLGGGVGHHRYSPNGNGHLERNPTFPALLPVL